MKIRCTGPANPFVIGRIVDIVRTQLLELPESEQVKGVTLFLRVDEVGEGVKRCKVGDTVAYFQCSHIWLRDGTHMAVVHNDHVIGVVEELDEKNVKVHGERDSTGNGNGRILVP